MEGLNKNSESGQTLSEFPEILSYIDRACDVFTESNRKECFENIVVFLLAHPKLVKLVREHIVASSEHDPEAGSSLDRELGWELANRALS